MCVADMSGVVANTLQRQHLLRGRQPGHVLSVSAMPYIGLLCINMATSVLPAAAWGTAGQQRTDDSSIQGQGHQDVIGCDSVVCLLVAASLRHIH